MSTQREACSAWPNAVGPLLVLVGLLTLYWSSVASLAEQWTEPFGSGAHGFLLLTILVYLVVRRWHLESCPLAMRPRVGALLLLALLSVGWALGGLGNIRLLQDLTFFLMLVPSLWLILGYRVGTRLGWPLLLMLTAIPLWDLLTPLHREITTVASAHILKGLGISNVREGFVIMVSAGDFAVNEGCSGVAQITSALAVTGLYAYVERLSLLGSAVLMALGWLVAVAGNVLRVVIIVVAGQASEMQHPLVQNHYWLGWIIFGIAIAALLMTLGRRLPQANEAAEVGAVIGAGARAPGGRSSGAVVVFGSAVLVAMLIGPLLTTIAASNGAEMTPVASSPLPERVGPWQQSPDARKAWHPELVGADLERQAFYRDPSGADLSLFVATYADQRQGREAVFDGNRVYDRRRWREVDTPVRYRLPPGSTVPEVEQTLLQGEHGDQRLVWRWYVVRGRTLAGDLEAKLASIAAALRGDRSARVVVLSTPIRRDRNAARNSLAAFARQLGKALTASSN